MVVPRAGCRYRDSTEAARVELLRIRCRLLVAIVFLVVFGQVMVLQMRVTQGVGFKHHHLVVALVVLVLGVVRNPAL